MASNTTHLMPDPFEKYMLRKNNVEFNDVEIEDFTLDSLSRFADEDGCFTKSFDAVVKGGELFEEVSVISTYAKYESENGDFPAVQIRIIDDEGRDLYRSPVYEIGSSREFCRREWRVPPTFESYDTVRMSFIIPEGVRLHLRTLKIKHNYCYRERDIGIRYHGHAGCTAALGMQVTAEVGFTSCITIPKFTKDGIGVCLHDDETVIKELNYDDGSTIPEGSTEDKPVSEFTYEELLKLNVWRAKGEAFKGMRVPTMEEYFQICSSTGMQPIFSVHPALTKEEWLYVRKLLEKYRLLEHFWVKSNEEITHKLCLEVFDNDIAGYILIQGKMDNWSPDEMAERVGLDKARHNIVMEFFNGLVTEEKIKTAINQGYKVSIAAMGGGISGPRMQNLIDLGVTEFTVDRHCSMGLSW